VAARQRNKKFWDCASTQPYQWLHMFEKLFIGSYSTSSRLCEVWIHKLSYSNSTSEKADKADLLDPPSRVSVQNFNFAHLLVTSIISLHILNSPPLIWVTTSGLTNIDSTCQPNPGMMPNLHTVYSCKELCSAGKDCVL
jgi:hypothetical protein